MEHGDNWQMDEETAMAWAVPGRTRQSQPEAGPSSLPTTHFLGLQLADDKWDCLSQSLPGDSFGGGSFSPTTEIPSPAWAFGDFDDDYEPRVERRWSEHVPGSFDEVHLHAGVMMTRGRGSEGSGSAGRTSRLSANRDSGYATPRPPSRHIELPPAPYFSTSCLPPSPPMSSRSAPSLSVGPSRACSIEPETPIDEETIMESPLRPRRALSEDGHLEHIVKPGVKRKRTARDERMQAEAQKDFQAQRQAMGSEGNSGESTPRDFHDTETRKRLMLVNKRLEIDTWLGGGGGYPLYTQSATTSPR